MLTFNYLKSLVGRLKIDVFAVTGLDHVFVVIGRTPFSNLNDPKTWGKDAVVCDPWLGAVFPANELIARISALRDTNWDIQKKPLFLQITNIFSVSDLVYMLPESKVSHCNLEIYRKIKTTLSEFHTEQDKANRLSLAKSIVSYKEKVASLSPIESLVFLNLFDQVEHFLATA